MDDEAYAAILRAAAMEALGMLPDVNIATEDYGLAHKKQETSTAANEAALTPASEVSADAHRGIEHKAPALDIPGHSAVMIQAAERPASVKDDSAVSVQRDALPQKLGEPGDNTASVRRSLPFDATFALPGLPASVQCALRVWGSQLTANAFLGISRETLEPDTAPASAKYLSARHDAGSIDGGNAHQLQAPDATSVDALYVATDRPSEKYRKTRGWTVINSAPEGAAEDGVAHEPRDLLSDLQDALCFGIGERTSKRERKKAKRLNSVTALSPSQIKTGSHVTRSGTIYRPDAEGSSHPDQPVIEASPAAVTDALSTSHRLARTIGGRVNKTTTAVRAVKEKVNRRLAVQSVETEDDVPKLLKIVRMAFRPPKASRHLQEAGPAPVMAHVLPVERLAKGDIVQMWTDGSGGQKNAGAAFVYRERDGSWRGQQFTLPNEDNALVAEMTALHEALQFAQRLCAERPAIQEIQLFTDCQTSLPIFQWSVERRVTWRSSAARELASSVFRSAKFFEGRDVILNVGWVKGHAGEEGNDKADKLAKRAARGENGQGIINGFIPAYVVL